MECKDIILALFYEKSLTDLIETLWNVKLDPDIHTLPQDHRFNRNIVECKENMVITNTRQCRDLIETLWNVKNSQDIPRYSIAGRFNRNIVECKDYPGRRMT